MNLSSDISNITARIAASSAAATDNKNYFDLKTLDDLASVDSSDPKATEAALYRIGGQFESMLLQQMLQSMRSANDVLFKDSLINTSRVKFYQEMLDDQLALGLAGGQGTGLAEQFVQNMAARYDLDIKRDASVSNSQTAGASVLREAAESPVLSKPRSARTEAPQIHQDQMIESSPTKTEGSVAVGEPTQDTATSSLSTRTASLDERALDFVQSIIGPASTVAAKLGIKVSLLLAQAALETGWGKKMIRNAQGDSSFNLFGIKAGEAWEGEKAETLTTEYYGANPVKVSASFRSYESYKESFDDFFQLLTKSDRYHETLSRPEEEFYFSLQSAGYATDPEYAPKIYGIAERIERSFPSTGSAENASRNFSFSR